jgi:hypothetical protein
MVGRFQVEVERKGFLLACTGFVEAVVELRGSHSLAHF